MKSLIASLFVVACLCGSAFGQLHYLRSDIEDNVTVVDDGSGQYSLTSDGNTQKALMCSPHQGTHNAIAGANVGSSIRLTYNLAYYGEPGSTEAYRYVTRTPTTVKTGWLLIVNSNSGTVTKDAPGKFQINIGGANRKVVFHASALSAGVTAFDAAATSGDPVSVIGMFATRGSENWFVVEKLP